MLQFMTKQYGRKIDIDKRTLDFAINTIKLVNKLPKTSAGFAVGNQLSRSCMSIGANVEEAQDAVSVKDFVHILSISLKEARETKYWLKIVKACFDDLILETDKLSNECDELIKIIAKIIHNTKKKLNN